ncbi:MAG: plasmid recombination protein [Clostridia bacterium]|nr:plasmid recombination protein [Clostridia bacterium]
MGWTIGMPSLKLNNAGTKSKHCGNFGKVAAEALEERKGRDPDIDRERTAENVYSGFRSAAELQEYSKKHVDEISARQVAAGGRKVRADAVVMCATIIKPPAAMMRELSRVDQIRFFGDAREKLAEIVGEDNIKSEAMHFDEQGVHLHVFWEPQTPDGRLCAKEMHNLTFLGRLNREMPEHLRSKGWDIENCKAYDQANETDKEKTERRANQGRSSAQFKADVEREKFEMVEDIDRIKRGAESEIEALGEAKKKAEQELKEVEKATSEGKEELERLKDAKGPIGRTGPLRKTIDGLQERNGQLENENAELRKDIERQQEVIEDRERRIGELWDRIERQKEAKTSLNEQIKEVDTERLQEENSKLRKTIQIVRNALKERFPEASRYIESLFGGQGHNHNHNR